MFGCPKYVYTGSMMIMLHIAVALASIAAAALSLLRPTKTKLITTYSLVGATLASGTYLVWSSHSPLLPACTTGLVYLALVSSALVLAQRRFWAMDRDK